MGIEYCSSCVDCGGEMIGDGYTVVEHCESAEDDTYWYNAPDDGPVYCGFEKFTVAELKTGLATATVSITCATDKELKAKIVDPKYSDFYRAVARYEFSRRNKQLSH